MLIDTKAFLTMFVIGVFEDVIKKCRTVILVKELDLSELMVHAQHIEGKKINKIQREKKRTNGQMVVIVLNSVINL